MRSFEDLNVYQKARAFRIDVSNVVKGFSIDEKYRLTDQLLRSSRSVTAQIAEGHGRIHSQENIQFCRIARGSLDETHEHLNTALDEGLIDKIIWDDLIEKKTAVIQLLNGYINYPRKSKHGETIHKSQVTE